MSKDSEPKLDRNNDFAQVLLREDTDMTIKQDFVNTPGVPQSVKEEIFPGLKGQRDTFETPEPTPGDGTRVENR